MPIKFFQKATLANEKTKSTEKLLALEELKFLIVKGGFGSIASSKISSEIGIFSKTAWTGLKISWNGGHLYCSENAPVLLNDYAIVQAKELRAEKHKLLSEKFKDVPITKIETGKILCGQKKIFLEKTENDADAMFYLVSGVWVGDANLEEKMDSKKQNTLALKYIFPSNPIVRGFRRILLGMMGNKEKVM